MRIVEDEYNWKRADATVVVLEEGTENVEFETPLKIYRIRGEGEISIYEDEEKSELVYSGFLPFEPDIPICFTSLMFVADEGAVLTLVSETGIQKTVLDEYLNTTEGMSYISNGYNDDGTFSTAGLEEFLYNGVAASTLYISSNHWIGFGVNSAQLYILQRDGCSTAIWRQEGECGNGVKFLKIRFEGYTVYSDRGEYHRLIFELFIMSNKDMFLNVIQTPTNGNIGISQFVCNNQTIPLSLADPTGAGGGTMVSFYHEDDEGKTWRLVYDNYKGIDYFSYGFLLKADEKYCTIVDGVLKEVTKETPTAADYYEFGFLDVPPSEILVGIDNPQISYWRAGGDTELIKTVAKAYPYPHYIKSEVDMSHISILGIMMMTAQYSGDVRVKFSLDNEETYSDEITMGTLG